MNKMFDEMLRLVGEKHFGQVDKGGNPYTMHLIEVMNGLNTDDIELKCIALGHDLLEDTDCTGDTLLDLGFTVRVVKGILDMTKSKNQTHKEYQDQVLRNIDATRVKESDLRHNSDIRRLKGVTDKDFERMKKYHKFYLRIQSRLREWNSYK